MLCPKCRDQKLERRSVPIRDRSIPGPDETVRTLGLDQCPACSGAWFDAGELEKYLDARATSLPKPAQPVPTAAPSGPGKCPQCGVALEQRPAPSNPRISVDACARCGGLWLDAGEWEEAGGQGLSFQERMKAVFGDLRPQGG